MIWRAPQPQPDPLGSSGHILQQSWFALLVTTLLRLPLEDALSQRPLALMMSAQKGLQKPRFTLLTGLTASHKTSSLRPGGSGGVWCLSQGKGNSDLLRLSPITHAIQCLWPLSYIFCSPCSVSPEANSLLQLEQKSNGRL